MSFQKPYGSRVRVGLSCSKPSLTKQAFKKDCDVNAILGRWQKTGLLEHVSRFQGRYEDLGGVVDYQTALNQVHEAQDAFMTLPSKIREKFGNDPGAFLAFVEGASESDLRELGLLPTKRLQSEDQAAGNAGGADQVEGA